jgi:hypothetical protein
VTAPISLTLDPDSPLGAHLSRADALLAAGVAVRRARLLSIAYYLSGPFPQATELVVTVADDGRIDLVSIADADGDRWTDDGSVSTCPEGYYTAENVSVDGVLETIDAELEDLLGDDDPATVWEALGQQGTYRVRLPDPAELERVTTASPPPADCGDADITSLIDAMSTLRTWLRDVRVAGSPQRGPVGSVITADVLHAELDFGLAYLEASAVAARQRHRLRCDRDAPHRRPRLEIVVDRDPDAGTDVAAFLDGVRQNPEVTVVDPGAGHHLGCWRQAANQHAHRASPEAAALIRAWFTAAESGPFVIP